MSLYLHTTSEGGSLLRRRFDFLRYANPNLISRDHDDDEYDEHDKNAQPDGGEEDRENSPNLDDNDEYDGDAGEMYPNGRQNGLREEEALGRTQSSCNSIFGVCGGKSTKRDQSLGDDLRHMSIVVAFDSWNSTTPAKSLCEAVEQGLQDSNVRAIYTQPLSTGGHGWLDAFKQIFPTDSDLVPVSAIRGPNVQSDLSVPCLFVPSRHMCVIQANLLLSALNADGLPPESVSSYGIGQIILYAIEHDCRKIIIGLSECHCIDGGAGLAQALGVRFLDAEEQVLAPGSQIVPQAKICVLTDVDVRVADDVELILATDTDACFLDVLSDLPVETPESPQAAIRTHIATYANAITVACNRSTLTQEPKLAAGGGMAFVLANLFPNCHWAHGFDILLSESRLREKIEQADLLITGEPVLNSSFASSLACRVTRLANEVKTDAMLFTVESELAATRLPQYGIGCVMPLIDSSLPEGAKQEAHKNSTDLLRKEVFRAALVLRIGKRVDI